MIDTVLFDMGGTLEEIYSDQKTMAETAKGIRRILQKHDICLPMDDVALWTSVSAGMQRYKRLSEQTCMELKPEQIWPEYALNSLPVDKERLIPISEELAYMWELTFYTRKMRPRVHEMLEGLREMGMRMGVVSNTASLYQVFETLEEYGIRSYFEDVTLSSTVGYRKPNPNIFFIALHQLRAKPENCAYVGDTISRDVIGAKNAGFGLTLQINSFLTADRDVRTDGIQPDYMLNEIYDVYPICKMLREAENKTA